MPNRSAYSSQHNIYHATQLSFLGLEKLAQGSPVTQGTQKVESNQIRLNRPVFSKVVSKSIGFIRENSKFQDQYFKFDCQTKVETQNCPCIMPTGLSKYTTLVSVPDLEIKRPQKSDFKTSLTRVECDMASLVRVILSHISKAQQLNRYLKD